MKCISKIRCAVIRGGTSKGVYILANDLPSDPGLRDKVILSIFGSPDKRQIDGLGGADPLTSKVAIVGPSEHNDADVEYTFGQVGINEPVIFKEGICGNISSGVGPFAVDEGLVKAEEPLTTIRVFNTNTGRIFKAEVPVVEGKVATEGNYRIDGVPGTGAKILLDFSETTGAVTGKLLPTGNLKDKLEVHNVGLFNVSIVDCSAVQVFIKAEEVGMTGLERPEQVDEDAKLQKRLELIRGTVACHLGLSSSPERALNESANSPHLVIVSGPASYQCYLNNSLINGQCCCIKTITKKQA